MMVLFENFNEKNKNMRYDTSRGKIKDMTRPSKINKEQQILFKIKNSFNISNIRGNWG